MFDPKRIRFAVIVVVTVPLLISLAWRGAMLFCDHVSQAGLLLLAVLPPRFTPAQSGPRNHFSLVFLTTLAWGVWRLFYFDPLTGNDVPGIGYLVLPFIMVGISALAIVVWACLAGRRSQKSA